ncbi:multiple monosaccharide ABC transporter substrate-binding protein [Cellulomonas fimi]|uniref:Multiple monosaccharide-binding protein n=1 Tax=Cellulomonas fimi (strain ATCC 484 / DSM 20113 / JCM 1341 / CCUG 24087 / LMG 16345 / NBRC 15513 / NCIMB 8980 / NCTC 7547 / NRS-133) TaxID=590998 RepID=F4GYC5_CELFA|nr:multiple monosaccharide ABC transporter substrate-binding protein [Cellulomonas fimi]AEE45914.1 multiple monosaccharide-binding protein [Cellulomonas fimi ATCC 484]NNH06759.1 sugar ABC transporter substrate-binding protein [Cellulomonas fimi]VEH30982.1 Multiple sugar-binding periplasmic protein sbpA precursor [Cellulomonas fimi]
MRRRTGPIVGSGVVAAVLALAACATPGAEPADDGSQLVGVAMPTTTSQRWIADGENVTAQLEALGHDVDLQFADDDVPTQIAQIEAMIDAGAEALVVGSIDGTALKDVLARAAAQDIPVIAYDRLIRDSGDIAYYATFDNERVGIQQGTSLLQGLGVLDAAGAPTGAQGPFAVELFAGSPDDNNATVFYEGAMGVLQPWIDSGVLVVTSGETDFATIATPAWNGDTAASRLGPLLDTHYASTRLDGILAPADIISVPLLDVLRDHGYGTAEQPWPVVTGQDADVAAVKAVVAGEQFSTVYKDTRQLAEVAVQMVDALLSGQEPETNDVTSYDNGVMVVPSYLLQPQLVTKDNYVGVLIDSGYYTQEDLA